MEKILERFYDPLIKRVEGMHEDLYGREGLKVRMAITETVSAALHQRLDDIERKQDRAFWFTMVTTVGIIVSVLVTR